MRPRASVRPVPTLALRPRQLGGGGIRREQDRDRERTGAGATAQMEDLESPPATAVAASSARGTLRLQLLRLTRRRSGVEEEEDGLRAGLAAVRTLRRASHTAFRSLPAEDRRRLPCCAEDGDAAGDDDAPPTRLAKSLARTLIVRTVFFVSTAPSGSAEAEALRRLILGDTAAVDVAAERRRPPWVVAGLSDAAMTSIKDAGLDVESATACRRSQ